MSWSVDNERERLVASVERRAAAGQIDRRSVLVLLAAIGAGSTAGTVGAPVRDGAGYMDLDVKDGRRFGAVHGDLLPTLDRQKPTLVTEAPSDRLRIAGALVMPRASVGQHRGIQRHHRRAGRLPLNISFAPQEESSAKPSTKNGR